ncbi:cation diffusion facilitator family transporter [Fluviispira multicolorata]|uniref:Cation diffusion facilitator family transporter n=1 Tax=Fluviispira multicolorata TaxID=2654512 RepID=A0A833JD60_9BACT|nr:cation diffusion facilitator family transporter [Fluviispira multicolorata]KAB8031063.1 cation diffusion facilitator family transporter [Fluviispira multicolorata]
MLHRLTDGLSNSKIAQRAALVAAICAAFLAVGKLTLFFMTGSLIVALSAWDSTMDMIVSLVNRKIVKFARLDADHNHPYGHGRAESIAALGQGSLIIGGGIAIAVSSVRQIYDVLNGQTVLINHSDWKQIVFFIFAAFVSLFVTKWLKVNGLKLNSPALIADAEHYKVDFVTNISSTLALFLVAITGYTILDPILALLFSGYIIYGSLGLVKTSINELMDHDIPDDIKLIAIEIVKKTDERILDIHRFRARKSGHKYFFDFHVTLPESLLFNEVHYIIDKIEHVLSSEFEGDVIVHADPSSVSPD